MRGSDEESFECRARKAGDKAGNPKVTLKASAARERSRL
jgi:hypothetical protein